MTTFAVCIVNHNTCDLLRDCLRSVVAEAPAEVVVFDSASIDWSTSMVRREFPLVRLIASGLNVGYGTAANRAIAACRADYVLCLNSDTRVAPGGLAALHSYMDGNPRAAIVGPRLLNCDGTPQTSCFRFPKPLHIFLFLSGFSRAIRYLPIVRRRSLQADFCRSAGVVPWVLGAAMGVRRTAFTSAGGFDESFFMYFEEVDLCYRLRRAGWEIHFSPAAEIVHVGGASTGLQVERMKPHYFGSLDLFYRRHYSRARRIELSLLLKGLVLARLIDGKAVSSLGSFKPQPERYAKSQPGAAKASGGLVEEGAERDVA